MTETKDAPRPIRDTFAAAKTGRRSPGLAGKYDLGGACKRHGNPAITVALVLFMGILGCFLTILRHAVTLDGPDIAQIYLP